MTAADRRTVLRWLMTATGGATLAGLVGACSGDALPERSADEVSFARPWADLADETMAALGRLVRAQHPSALAHARDRLTRLDLTTACRRDGDEGSVTSVAGWLLPTTLAGLADALADLTGPV